MCVASRLRRVVWLAQEGVRFYQAQSPCIVAKKHSTPKVSLILSSWPLRDFSQELQSRLFFLATYQTTYTAMTRHLTRVWVQGAPALATTKSTDTCSCDVGSSLLQGNNSLAAPFGPLSCGAHPIATQKGCTCNRSIVVFPPAFSGCLLS